MPVYPLSDIYCAIQGEGVNTGLPMVLVRLQGCNVGCVWCDTTYAWKLDPEYHKDSIADCFGENPYWCELSAPQILNYIKITYPKLHWLLVSGGEPGLYDLSELCNQAHSDGYFVAVETSGTAKGVIGARIDWLCISPKLDSELPVLVEALEEADEIKFVIGKDIDITRYERFLEDNDQYLDGATICLQPMSLSPRATQLCVQSVIKNNLRLSLQTHKYIHLR